MYFVEQQQPYLAVCMYLLVNECTVIGSVSVLADALKCVMFAEIDKCLKSITGAVTWKTHERVACKTHKLHKQISWCDTK